jgi:hypothetical protein
VWVVRSCECKQVSGGHRHDFMIVGYMSGVFVRLFDTSCLGVRCFSIDSLISNTAL